MFQSLYTPLSSETPVGFACLSKVLKSVDTVNTWLPDKQIIREAYGDLDLSISQHLTDGLLSKLLIRPDRGGICRQVSTGKLGVKIIRRGLPSQSINSLRSFSSPNYIVAEDTYRP